MEEIVKLLDKNLECVRYEVKDDRIVIWVKSSKKGAVCPCCRTPSTRVHSIYERTLQDLPIQGKKVTIVLICKKTFCDNENCSKKRFAEAFEFVNPRGKMTKRLEEEIVKISMNMSSIQASRLIRENIADIGKSSTKGVFRKKAERFRGKGKIHFLTAAVFQKLKNIDINLIALSNLKEYDWDYTIPGDGDERENPDNLVRELELQGRVTFLGMKIRGQVLECMKGSDVYVMFSALKHSGLHTLKPWQKLT